MSSARRMRLGTKSCAECRRRKVRCIYPPSSSTCESCATHEVRCLAQRPKDESSSSGRDSEASELKKRMEQLEGLVSQLQGALVDQSSSGASTHAVFSQTGSEASPSISTPAESSELPEHSFESASLVNLFSSTHIGQKMIDPARLGAGQTRRIRELKASLSSILPDQFVVRIVIDDTARYIGCWPACSYDAENSLALKPGDSQEAYDFVTRYLNSGKAAPIAKAILFFCSCVQQLSTGSKARHYLPANLHDLIDEYIDMASSLLYLSASYSDTMDGLEARMLLFKLCIDLAKPRLAWTTARSAVEVALLMGCHCPDADEKKKTIWEQVWKMDRQPSLMLGLPCAIHNAHPAVENSDPGTLPIHEINTKLARLFGNISDRDQKRRDDDYARTVQLDQDATEIWSLFPREWMQEETFQDMPLEQVYHTQNTILRYHTALRQVHLPFMLKSTTDTRYHHSRVSALDASRQVINAYLFMKRFEKTREINCELMDMEALSCCITLIVGLLSAPRAYRDIEQEKADFALLNECASDLRKTAELLGCSVARQASQVMEYLLGAMRHDPGIPEHFEAAIPFFGQMRISRSAVSRDAATADTQRGITDNVSSMDAVMPDVPQSYSNTIEFTADLYHQNVLCEFMSGSELGANWQDSMSWDTTFDWGQVFNDADFEHFNIADCYDGQK